MSFRDRKHFELQIIPSAGANVDTTTKAGWIDWTRTELFYYLLGRGYDVNVERSASPKESSKDITGSLTSWEDYDTAKPGFFLAQFDCPGDVDRDLERFVERTASEWYTLFDEYANPRVVEREDRSAGQSDDWSNPYDSD